jgi:hypothetical protein
MCEHLLQSKQTIRRECSHKCCDLCHAKLEFPDKDNDTNTREMESNESESSTHREAQKVAAEHAFQNL